MIALSRGLRSWIVLRFVATLAGAVLVVWVLSLAAAPAPEAVEGRDVTPPDGDAPPPKPTKGKLTADARERDRLLPLDHQGIVKEIAKKAKGGSGRSKRDRDR